MEKLNNNDKKIIDLSYDINNELKLNEREKIDDLYREYLESVERVKKNNEKINMMKKDFFISHDDDKKLKK